MMGGAKGFMVKLCLCSGAVGNGCGLAEAKVWGVGRLLEMSFLRYKKMRPEH